MQSAIVFNKYVSVPQCGCFLRKKIIKNLTAFPVWSQQGGMGGQLNFRLINFSAGEFHIADITFYNWRFTVAGGIFCLHSL